ncbi:MAG: hypothetical protein NXH78_01325 [Hyphomonadaceae bacterium]|nr:hypothetical protein [Hyphomonadaceae bacterium]
MVLLTALSILGFVLVVLWTNLVGESKRVIAISNDVMSVFRDPAMDDEAREKAAQKASLQLFKSFFGLLIRFAAAIAGAIVPIGLASLTGWIPLHESIGFLSRIDVIVVTTGMMIALWWMSNAISREDKDGYSAMDRALHHVALSGSAIPKILFEMEQSRFPATSPDPTGPHIVVCGLARAGTTVITRDIYATGLFGSLTYRDMPFAMAPNSFNSTTSSASLEAKERSHGDGVIVDLDSAEAIDEVFWRVHAGEDYIRKDRLVPHVPSADHIKLFREYRRLILHKTGKQRYLAKANNTALRLDQLAAELDDTLFVVPFRNPLDQARSLKRQHQRFSGSSKFQRKYMAWLGHFEFGDTHRPFAFQNMPRGTPDALNYWLDIWLDVYASLLTVSGRRENVILVSYDDLCVDPTYQGAVLEKLEIGEFGFAELKQRQADHDNEAERVPERVHSLYLTMRARALELVNQ